MSSMLAIGQAFLLVVGCGNAALGLYALLAGRLPRLPVVGRDRLDPRRYGAGQILMSTFAFSMVLSQVLMDRAPDFSMVLIMAGFGLFLGGIWLTVPTEGSQRSF